MVRIKVKLHLDKNQNMAENIVGLIYKDIDLQQDNFFERKKIKTEKKSNKKNYFRFKENLSKKKKFYIK